MSPVQRRGGDDHRLPRWLEAAAVAANRTRKAGSVRTDELVGTNVAGSHGGAWSVAWPELLSFTQEGPIMLRGSALRLNRESLAYPVCGFYRPQTRVRTRL